jgi:hypothetical protein
MPPKRTHLQSPNPVKLQMLDDDCENTHLNQVIVEDDVIVAPPSTPPAITLGLLPTSLPTPTAPATETSNIITAPAAMSDVVMLAPAVSPPPPESPLRSVTSVGPLSPQSPTTNRSRFLTGVQPVRVCCNLDLMKSTAGAKIAITAICIAVFPASKNPDRRYIQLADQYGSAGLTVWNSNVSLFGSPSVGKLVTCKRLVVQSHNGKRCLTMARDSTIEIEDAGEHSVMDWWRGLLQSRVLNALEAHDAVENSIISLSGVVGQITEESKIVSGVTRVLTTLHMVDATGKYLIRTWNHVSHGFHLFIDKPVTIQRVRVTAYAGEKLAELLDGNGSVFLTDFPGCSKLLEWWNSA